MGDRQGRAALGQLVKALADQDLALVVQRTGGLVQQQDARVLQKYAGDGKALLLPARKLDAALTDIGVVAVLQCADKAVGSGQTGGLLDLGAGRTGAAVGDVLRHGAAEQIDILLHHADGLAQAAQCDAAHILPVDQDLAARHIIKAGDQVAERGLAAAGGADQRNILAGADFEIDMAQDLIVIIGVLKADIAEVDAALPHLQRLRTGKVGDGDGGVHDLGKALNAGHAALELLGKFHDAADGSDQCGDIQHIGHQIARADGTVHEGKTAGQNDDKIHQAVKKAGGGVEGRHGVIAQRLDFFKIAVALLKLFALQILGRKGLDHPLAEQTVLNGGVQFTDLKALLAEPLAQLVVQFDRDNAHQRHTGKDNEGQRYVGLTEDHERGGDLYACNEKLLRAVVGKLGHIEQVVRDAAHDLADLGVVVVGVVELQQMVKGIAAHIGLDMHAHDMANAGHKVAGCTVNDAQHKVERRQLQHGFGRQGRRRDRVCQGAHDFGQGNVAQGRQCGAEQIKGQHAAVLDQIGEKASDQRTVFRALRSSGFGHGYLFRLIYEIERMQKMWGRAWFASGCLL